MSDSAMESLAGATGAYPVTIAFANYDYRELVYNWIRAADRIALDNYWIVALDNPLLEELVRRGIPTLECERDRYAPWQNRLSIFKQLVSGGIDFIHSDIDAVWLRDPRRRYYHEFPFVDLLISQGTFHPVEAFDRWHLVLCCGWFLMRSTRGTMKLLTEMQSDVAVSGGDQGPLNRALLRRELRWEFESERRILYRKRLIRVSEDLAMGYADGITVGLIPFFEVPRLALEEGEPWVSHPATYKNVDAKRQMFEGLGLWV